MNKFPFYQTYITQKEAIDKAIREVVAFVHAKLGSDLVNKMLSHRETPSSQNKRSTLVPPLPPSAPYKPNPQSSIEDFNEPMPNKRCLYTDKQHIGNKQNSYTNNESQSTYID